MKADLHVHSVYSDSDQTVDELAALAEVYGVSVLGITDHDTLLPVLTEDSWISINVELVPGLELSCVDPKTGRKVHLLGYRPDPDYEPLQQLCRKILCGRNDNSKALVEFLRDKGFEISWEKLMNKSKAGGTVYRQHILRELFEKGYQTSVFGEIFRDYIRPFQPVKSDYADVYEGLDILKKSGAAVSLAHPGLYDSFELIPALADAGLDAIEVYHPASGPLIEKKALDMACQFGLLVTGGSDFHGLLDEDPDKKPGKRACSLDQFYQLKERMKK